MLITIKGENFSEYIYKEIMNLTDHSILHINDVKHDKEDETLCLFLERYRFLKIKRVLFGIIEAPTMYDRSSRIRTSVIIKNVIDLKVDNNYPLEVSETIIGGGITVKDNKHIYICSQEDYHGKLSYFMKIDVSSIDITISDLEAV